MRFTVILFVIHALLPHSGEAANKKPVSLSILSVLQPTAIRIIIRSSDAVLITPSHMNSPLSKDSQLLIQIAGEQLQVHDIERSESDSPLPVKADRVSLRCAEGCVFGVEIPEKLNRQYSGNLELSVYQKQINAILEMDQDDLLSGILASEMGQEHNIQSLRAFAVVARSFLYAGKRHPDRNADLCDTTHCQVFRNLDADALVRSAVRDTDGIVLTYNHHVFRPYYFQSCSGKTATPEEVWNKSTPDYPFFSVDCAWCSHRRPHWRTILSFSEIRNIFLSEQVKASELEDTFSKEQFRILAGRFYGWERIPGNHFIVSRDADRMIFQGTGRGHRVGFCQIGATGMANHGKSFHDILAWYFPRSELKSLGDKAVSIHLFRRALKAN